LDCHRLSASSAHIGPGLSRHYRHPGSSEVASTSHFILLPFACRHISATAIIGRHIHLCQTYLRHIGSGPHCQHCCAGLTPTDISATVFSILISSYTLRERPDLAAVRRYIDIRPTHISSKLGLEL
jgi:hypothetical protein